MKLESITGNVTGCIGQNSQNADSKHRTGMLSMNVLFSEIFSFSVKICSSRISFNHGFVLQCCKLWMNSKYSKK